jgi:hypothetical protein
MFSGRIGSEHFFIPLGRMAKDAFGNNQQRETAPSDR